MDHFLAAMVHKDRAALKSYFDFPALVRTLDPTIAKKPAVQQVRMIHLMEVVVPESFAMGPQTRLVIKSLTSSGNNAVAITTRTDPRTHHPVPATLFRLHKQGGRWLIYQTAPASAPAARPVAVKHPARPVVRAPKKR